MNEIDYKIKIFDIIMRNNESAFMTQKQLDEIAKESINIYNKLKKENNYVENL